MAEDALSAQIRKLVGSYSGLRVDAADLSDADDLYELGMTSTANVNLMLALEEEFDIEFPEELLVRATFESLSAIRRSVEQVQSASEGTEPAWT